MPEQVQYEMSLNDLVSGKLNKAEQSAQKFEGRLGHVQGALSQLGERAVRVAETLGISFGIYKIAEFAHEGVEMAHQLGQAEAQLKAGIISTNGAAGVSYEELEESALHFSKTLSFTQAQIVDMQSQLITFPGVTAKTFEAASQSIMDMATRLHKGLDETAIQVGKALQDPIKGVNALHRVGVNFSATQTEVIKKLVETGKVGEAQALILHELQTEFAGSAKAAAEADPLFRYNKLMEGIKLSVGEAGESLLHDITPGLETAANAFRYVYDETAKFIGYLKANGPAIIKEIKNDTIALAAGVGVATVAFLIANPTVIAYGVSLAADAVISGTLAVVTGVLTAAQWALNVALTANPIGLIVVAIGALVTGLVLAYEHSWKFRAAISGIMEVAREMVPMFKGLGDVIIGAFTFDPAQIKRGFDEVATGFKNFSLKGALVKGIQQSLDDDKKNAAEEKHQSTIGKEVGKKKTPAIATTKAGTQTTSKVSGSKVLNIHINIGNLVKDITIKTTNMTEGASKVKDLVANALLSAVNDSELATDI